MLLSSCAADYGLTCRQGRLFVGVVQRRSGVGNDIMAMTSLTPEVFDIDTHATPQAKVNRDGNMPSCRIFESF
jgi:hypothetical protein